MVIPCYDLPMKYTPALLEGFLQMHESIIWTLTGHFDSHHILTGRRLRRRGCMVATPWRLLFVSIDRERIQLESISFAQIDDIDLEQRGLKRVLVFSVSGNACRLSCLFNQPVRMNMYWLRQRVEEIRQRVEWHAEGPVGELQGGPVYNEEGRQA